MKTSKENILALQAYHPGNNVAEIILNANENPRNITGEYMDEIVEMLADFQFNRYPDTDSVALRKAYSAYCGADAENIVCGNGSDEMIRLIIQAYVDKGDCILVHDPTFSMYEITCTAMGGSIVKVKAGSDFEVNAEDIISAAKKHNPKIIFICNPNNPTGNVISRDDIIKIITETDAVVAVDEAYIEFGGETVIDLINTYDNLLVLRTLSKAFGLCGLRIGFAVGGSDIIEMMEKVRAPYNLNQLSQNIGVIALSHTDRMREQVQVILANRDKLMAELQKLSCLDVYATHANFIYARADARRIAKALGNSVSIRIFGKDAVRISVGEQEENSRLIELLGKVK